MGWRGGVEMPHTRGYGQGCGKGEGAGGVGGQTASLGSWGGRGSEILRPNPTPGGSRIVSRSRVSRSSARRRTPTKNVPSAGLHEEAVTWSVNVPLFAMLIPWEETPHYLVAIFGH